ncbi:MAG: tRNA pseudouridine(55) synthase TruB [Bacteroidetes bacterium]|nr:tRNA pseudouridine(55) synthase TruB [Bacteroidota bacterium]
MTEQISVNNPFEEGIILLNKPLNWTSFNVVKKVRYLLKGKKVGHAGTLDPLATGLVIVCIGKATKIIESIQAQPKVYTGSFFLGAVTDSYDLETTPKPTDNLIKPTQEQIMNAAQELTGEIIQTPPIFSAIKIGGKRAYQYARQGANIKMKSRKTTVYEFDITEINFPIVSFRIKCSKGTYIRSIANDFGKILGTGAYLNSLCRTQIGEYKLGDAYSINEFEEFVKQNEVI